jgi:hypothetical protein
LEWNESAGAGNGPYEYRVYVDDSPDFPTPVSHDSGWMTEAEALCDGSTCSWTFTSTNNTKWYWKVRARDPNHSNVTSDWSDSDYFWVVPLNSPPFAPTPIPEPDFNGGGTITLEWYPEADPDENPVQYYVEVDDSPDFSVPEFTSGWTSDLSFDITVGPCTAWNWRVKARDASDLEESGWSSTDYFRDSTVGCGYTIIKEFFEGTGYEEAWTENIGTNCILNEDYSPIPGTPPVDFGSQCLQSVSNSTGYEARADFVYGSQQSKTFTTFYVYVGAESLGSNDNKNIGALIDSGGNSAIDFRLFQGSAGNLKFRFRLYNDGLSTNYNSTAISLNTWYKIEIKYDDTGDTWGWKVNGTTQNSGTLTGTHRTGIQQWRIGFWKGSQAEIGTVYFDRLTVSIDAFD